MTATHAIPLYLYIKAVSDDDAKRIRDKVKTLLEGSLVAGVMQGQGIPSCGVVVQDPMAVPK